MEPRIGRDDRILLLNRKREIEAVVDRMVEIIRQPGGQVMTVPFIAALFFFRVQYPFNSV